MENIEARISIEDLASFFIYFGQAHGEPVTNLKLQKLCYYAEAYYWAIYEKPLTGEPFEAWTHGPVSRTLWDLYRDYRWEPILKESQLPEFPKNIQEYLEEIARVFFRFSAYQLERMTHNDKPWQKARGDLPIESKCENTIQTTDMMEYYKRYVT